MRIRPLIGGLAALAGIAGAAVAFLWQGIMWLQFEKWPKLSVASVLYRLDARAWARLAHKWPDGYALLDAIPLSMALLGLAVLGYAVVKWGANR